MNDTTEQRDVTLAGRDGRLLLMSCQTFVNEIVMGDACFVCGASPRDKMFNDEHIIPRWILKRFGLFDKQITLPSGERRHYRGYRIPCCVTCNSLLGDTVEAPISQLLDGDYQGASHKTGTDIRSERDFAMTPGRFTWNWRPADNEPIAQAA